MGGRIRWGNAGEVWADVSQRTLRWPSNTDAPMSSVVNVAWAKCVQAHAQIPDLQQSGAGCFDFSGAGWTATDGASSEDATLAGLCS